ncbi:MAG: chorismate--pyruvate lyase family protein [Pseudoalteromonas sp.]|uniref:chorismate--pyruvate lyase family protein n=1 Tax=unclassified Pseudoalteromonas TaxID=194690 RepID=UPI003F95CE5B
MNRFPLSLKANWQLGHSVADLSKVQRDWLLEPGSLTAKLKSNAATFAVEVLSEQRFALSEHQQRLLNCSCSHAMNREVLLLCDDVAMVYAQSWLPISSAMEQQRLLGLGDKPLGDIIFQHPELSRIDIEIAYFDSQQFQQFQSSLEQNTTPLWGRRSIFSLKQSQFLVAEVFLPGAYIYL